MKKYMMVPAVFLMLTLAACGGKTAKDKEDEATTTAIVIELESETQEESSALPEESAQALPEGENLVESQSPAAATETERVPETTTEPVVYKVNDLDKTMYVIKGVNVRESYTTGSKVLSTLKAGQEIEATGMSENGWVRIKFNGGEAYVYKTYLSESKDDVETTAASTTAAKKETAGKQETGANPQTPAATQPQPAEIPETIPPSPIS